MATRISVVKNPNGQFAGWTCKHSSKIAPSAECNGHVVLCRRCASSVGNGAQLLNDDTREPIEPAKITVSTQLKAAAVAR